MKYIARDNEKRVLIMDERKYELINELAIATAKGDYDTMEEIACELYEVYGWFGNPYYCWVGTLHDILTIFDLTTKGGGTKNDEWGIIGAENRNVRQEERLSRKKVWFISSRF